MEHNRNFFAIPGQVLYAIEGDPIIACGEGILQLTEVTFDNKDDKAKAAILKLK